MKISAEDFAIIKTEILDVVTTSPHLLNSMRGMWDAFYSINPSTRRRLLHLCGYNRTHFETAFRKIMST